MSKIDFKPPAGGTGVFSFVPPATNTDRTITLPDAGGQLHTSESVNDHASMPTVGSDPIVESGSNTDGRWTKFADGTLFVSHAVSTSSSTDGTWTFPVASTVELRRQITATSGSPGVITMFRNDAGLTSSNFAGYNTSGARLAAGASLVGMGRWK